MGPVASLPAPQLKGHIWFAEDVRRMLVLGLLLLTFSLWTNLYRGKKRKERKPVLCVFECVHVCACVCACMCVCGGGMLIALLIKKKQNKKTADIWKHSMLRVWLLRENRTHLSDFTLWFLLLRLVNKISEGIGIALVSSGFRVKVYLTVLQVHPVAQNNFILSEDIWDLLPYRKAAEKLICQLESKLTGVGRKDSVNVNKSILEK